eukprot:TRINITY_DN18677_c0_g1_i1.p1 TRINITY_DN18677_c0_g1~~TRINITY_DN18677_c0_g1_i1.p1  ORF type:complete len:370 (-),score=77.07 TRINITY_DN18677_c0_g1_i1:35-1105(-)
MHCANMMAQRLTRSAVASVSKAARRAAASSSAEATQPLGGATLGFVGLGKIGSGMISNLARSGASVFAYDRDAAAVASACEAAGVSAAADTAAVARAAPLVFTALPDDKALAAVCEELLPALAERSGDDRPIHISCSTVSPEIANRLASAHAAAGVGFVSAPVFARPDGMRRGEATIPMSGPAWAKEKAEPVLRCTASGVHDFGEDAAAANVVKLGGNFLIAAAIESMAEASALAESHGVDRERFISLMSSTIFDCLIYKGYGHRVAARDHHPYPDAHFALDLGSKDVALVHQAAAHSRCPMPVASLLRDKFVASQNCGRGQLDWSAVALRASEDAGSTQVGPAVKKLLSELPAKP